MSDDGCLLGATVHVNGAVDVSGNIRSNATLVLAVDVEVKSTIVFPHHRHPVTSLQSNVSHIISGRMYRETKHIALNN